MCRMGDPTMEGAAIMENGKTTLFVAAPFRLGSRNSPSDPPANLHTYDRRFMRDEGASRMNYGRAARSVEKTRIFRGIRSVAMILGMICLHSSQALFAQETISPQQTETERNTGNSAGSLTTIIVVVGAGGQEEYSTEFAKWADKWSQLAKQQQWNLVTIGEPQALAAVEPQALAAVDDSKKQSPQDPLTDSAKLEQAIANLYSDPSSTPNAAPGANKRLWLVLIGHGTAAGKVAKFNLRGPDVTTIQLKSWLDKVPSETVVIDCTSSSAPFLVELSAKNRIIVTATRSGGEVNFARFGGYLAESIGDIAADLDHDREVSLLEAFLKASKDTERFYRENDRLATEHALLDDNHDRAGTSATFYVGSIVAAEAKDGKAVDGKLAARVILWSSPDGSKLTSDQLVIRQQLESEIDLLRERKSKLPEAEYYDQLEALLLKLASLYDQAP
jgi:hypothetical protein